MFAGFAMMKLISRSKRSKEWGASLLEQAIIISLCACVAIFAVKELGNKAVSRFDYVSSELGGSSNTTDSNGDNGPTDGM